MHYSSFFQYFSMCYGSYSSLKFLCTCLLTFLVKIKLLLLVNPCILHQKKVMALCASTINYRQNEVSIMLHCQLCSTHYTTLRIKNFGKAHLQSKYIATIKIQMISFPLQREAITCYHQIDTFHCHGTQMRTLIRP